MKNPHANKEVEEVVSGEEEYTVPNFHLKNRCGVGLWEILETRLYDFC